MDDTNSRRQEFGRRVRQFRQDRRMSMKDLAKRSCISYGYVRAIEVGAVNLPSLDVIEQIAEALGVSRDQLLDADTSDREIDLSDPLISVSAAYADKLTPERKLMLADLIREMAAKGELEGV